VDNAFHHGHATEVRIYHAKAGETSRYYARTMVPGYRQRSTSSCSMTVSITAYFLAKEALAVTAIRIDETSQGGGACFEVMVPRGCYRFAPGAPELKDNGLTSGRRRSHSYKAPLLTRPVARRPTWGHRTWGTPNRLAGSRRRSLEAGRTRALRPRVIDITAYCTNAISSSSLHSLYHIFVSLMD